jgi:UV DNA damage endonuclease
MGLEPGPFHCLIVHGGGVFGDKRATLQRTRGSLQALAPEVRCMLVYENDEWHYNPLDLLPICEEFGLGFCFDIFHNRVSRQRIPVSIRLLERIFRTWHSCPPKMHFSEQRPGDRRGSHGDYATRIPQWLRSLTIIEHLDLMLECKMKERSVLRVSGTGSLI